MKKNQEIKIQIQTINQNKYHWKDHQITNINFLALQHNVAEETQYGNYNKMISTLRFEMKKIDSKVKKWTKLRAIN